MNFPKNILLECVDKTINHMIKEHEIEKLTKTGKQIKEYSKIVKNKFAEFPADVGVNTLYRFLTKTFENMSDRNNMVISSYIKIYCKTFVNNLQEAMGDA